MSKSKRVLRWVLTVFMVFGGIAYFPSVSSVLCWLFAVLAAPIKPLQRFWEYQVKLRGAAKVLIMVALFIGAVMTAPTNTVPVGPSANVQQQESQNSTEDVQEAPEMPQDASEAQDVFEDVQVPAEDSADKQEPAQLVQEAGETVQEPQEQPQANEPESEPQEADPQASEPDPAPVVTPEPEPQPDPAPQENQANSRTVYITPTGKRYHYDNSCNGGTYIPSTLAEAQAMGLTPCKKCAGG